MILIDRIREIAAQLGAQTDARPWNAHLTLARLKLPYAPNLSSLPKPPMLSLYIDSFELLQSTLSPVGAIYSKIRRFCALHRHKHIVGVSEVSPFQAESHTLQGESSLRRTARECSRGSLSGVCPL